MQTQTDLCMSACMHTSVCTFIYHIYIHVPVWIHTYSKICIFMHIHTPPCQCISRYVHSYAYINTCVYVCISVICLYTYMSAYICIYINTATDICIHKEPPLYQVPLHIPTCIHSYSICTYPFIHVTVTLQ